MLFLYNSIECGARKIKGPAFGASAPQAGFAIAYWQLGFRCQVSGVRCQNEVQIKAGLCLTRRS